MVSRGVGWLWLVFQVGVSVIGGFYCSYMVGKMGEIGRLWRALTFAVVGGLF